MQSTALHSPPAFPLEQPHQPSFIADDANNVAALIASGTPSESSSPCSGAPGLGLSIPFTPTNKPQATDQSENSKETLRKPSGTVPEPSASSVEGKVRVAEDSCMPARERSSTNGKNNEEHKAVPYAKLEPVAMQAMQSLLDQVPDLKEWLELTEFHNVESRRRKLDRYRRAKRLAAEKRRIEEEEQKLFEEEERDSNVQRKKREYDDAWDEERREGPGRNFNASHRRFNGNIPRSPRDRRQNLNSRRGAGGYSGYSPRYEY